MWKQSFVFLPFLLSCACSPAEKLDPAILYRRDMTITINGKTFTGVAVAPVAEKYDIKAQTIGRNDVFTFTTCHQETEFRPGRNDLAFTFVPRTGLENGKDSCIAELGGFDKDKGRHSWGIIAFENPLYRVTATVDCNGQTYDANGVALCQSLISLKQRIRFKYPVKISPSIGCRMLTPADELVFEYEMVKGRCEYEFWEPSFSRRFRLTTFGYQEILIKQD